MATAGNFRAYGSYFGRLFGLVIIGLLIIGAVWFVIRLATDNGDTATTSTDSQTTNVVSLDGTTATDSETAAETETEADLYITDTPITTADQSIAISPQTLEAAATETSDTVVPEGELPNTGPGDLLWMIPLSLAAMNLFWYRRSRMGLRRIPF